MPSRQNFCISMSLSSIGSKTSSLISTWGVTENKGEESSLWHWHHFGAEAQQKPTLALGSLHSWVSSCPLPCWGRQGLAACKGVGAQECTVMGSENRTAEMQGTPAASGQMWFSTFNSLSKFWNGFSQWSLQHLSFGLFMEKALRRASGASKMAQSGGVSIEWWRTYLWLVH